MKLLVLLPVFGVAGLLIPPTVSTVNPEPAGFFVSNSTDFKASILRNDADGVSGLVIPEATQLTPDTVNLTTEAGQGPITATYHGQVIENLHVAVLEGEPAITIANLDNVTVRNVTVEHGTNIGIKVVGGTNVRIENVKVMNRAAPERGPHLGDQPSNRPNIYVTGSIDFQGDKLYLERGSSGVVIHRSLRPGLTRIEGFDFRGPFPRGQLVQFDQCEDPTLDTFTVINPGETAWTEDAVNSYGSVRPIIRNGYIEGINSPTGVGVLIENAAGGFGGLVENVVVRYWVNGAFMAANKSKNVVFRNVKAFDGLALAAVSASVGQTGLDGEPIPTLEQWAGSNFRGEPKSGQEAFLAYGASLPVSFEQAAYKNLARKNRVAWDLQLMTKTRFQKNARMRAKIYRHSD